MYEETIAYVVDGKEFIGKLIAPEKTNKDKKPAILVTHAWMGRDEFALQKARELAKLGYIAFAVDLYGGGKVVQTPEEAGALMMPLFLDRALLQKRMQGALSVLHQNASIDENKIGGIGFCFGGLAVIELLRSGANVKGVVTFHAGLGHQQGGNNAKTVPIAQNIKGALLMLHGYDDPLAKQQDVLDIQKEMNDAKVDWQMNIFGHTSHAFTNPEAHDPKSGLVFNVKSNQRAWIDMRNFFEEIFAK